VPEPRAFGAPGTRSAPPACRRECRPSYLGEGLWPVDVFAAPVAGNPLHWYQGGPPARSTSWIRTVD
jgi:hypothetical protein